MARIRGTTGDDRLTGTPQADLILGLAGNERLWGAGGDDEIDGGPGNDILRGEADDDLIRGAAGNDVIAGGDGADRVSGGAGNDHAWGDGGADRLWGDSGDDTLWGDGTAESANDGNDQLYGGDDDDVLYGSGGNDVLDGGAGDNLLVGGAGDDTIGIRHTTAERGTVVDTVNGGVGDDRVVLCDFAGPVLGVGPSVRIVGALGSGNDSVSIFDTVIIGYLRYAQVFDLSFGGGNDILDTGVESGFSGRFDLGAGDDRVFIWGGDIEMDLGDGDDSFVSGSTMRGVSGIVRGGWSNDRFQVGSDQYTQLDLYGGAGDDVIYVDQYVLGDHIASGGSGRDVLVDGDGYTVLGGPGADTFAINLYFDNPDMFANFPEIPDLVADFERGEDKLAVVRSGYQRPTLWHSLADFDTNEDGRLDDRDDGGRLEAISYGGSTRDSLVVTMPVGDEWPSTEELRLFGVTRLTAADFVTSGELPWA